MKEYNSTDTDICRSSSPFLVLKDLFSIELKKLYAVMSEEKFNIHEDHSRDSELEYYNNILLDRSEAEHERTDYSGRDMRSSRSSRSSIEDYAEESNSFVHEMTDAQGPLLKKLHEKRVNLVLVATSLDENDVVEKLKGTLDPSTSSMIPLTFDDDENGESDKNGNGRVGSLKDFEGHKSHERDCERTRPKRSVEEEKNDRYWKRRSSNNEAAKRSREARKARFEWIEKRSKELEDENEKLTQQLDSLRQKVLEMERGADKT